MAKAWEILKGIFALLDVGSKAFDGTLLGLLIPLVPLLDASIGLLRTKHDRGPVRRLNPAAKRRPSRRV